MKSPILTRQIGIALYINASFAWIITFQRILEFYCTFKNNFYWDSFQLILTVWYCSVVPENNPNIFQFIYYLEFCKVFLFKINFCHVNKEKEKMSVWNISDPSRIITTVAFLCYIYCSIIQGNGCWMLFKYIHWGSFGPKFLMGSCSLPKQPIKKKKTKQETVLYLKKKKKKIRAGMHTASY